MALREWKPRITFSWRVNRVMVAEQPAPAQALLVEYAKQRYHLVFCKVEGDAVAIPPVILLHLRILEDGIGAKSLPPPGWSAEAFVAVTGTLEVFSFKNSEDASKFEQALMNVVAKANLEEEDIQLRNHTLTYEAVSDFAVHGESGATSVTCSEGDDDVKASSNAE